MWAICAASVVGRAHAQKSLGCDDAYAYGVHDDFVVAAVADGAGSVTGTSAWGSYTACETVVQQALTPGFIDAFTDASDHELAELIHTLFSTTRAAVIDAARDMRLDPGRLATTLCVAIAQPGAAAFAQIGDGVIAIERGDEIQTILPEIKQEYANITWFLQSKDVFSKAFRSHVDRNTTAFALSTDGMSYKVTNVATGEAFRPFFRRTWENVRNSGDSTKLEAMLRNIPDDQTGDDKTLVVAALPGPGSQSPTQRHPRGTAAVVSSGWPRRPEAAPSRQTVLSPPRITADNDPELSWRENPPLTQDIGDGPDQPPRPTRRSQADRDQFDDECKQPRQPREPPPTRWPVATLTRVIMIFLVAAVSGVAGWTLRTLGHPSSGADTTASQELNVARLQTCGGYQVLSNQWSSAYRDWVAAVPQPLTASDPVAQAETTRFDNVAISIAKQMISSITPNTPNDVRNAITSAGGAVTSLAVSHSQQNPHADENATVAAHAAVDRANQACGIA